MQTAPPIIDVIIPAYNEADAIGNVIRDIDKKLVRDIVVVDNNSTDNTTAMAKLYGATVLHQSLKGYGAACLMGIDYIKKKAPQPDIVVFIDGDYSDFPEEMVSLVEPILAYNIDFVIGSRAIGNRQRGSMLPQQVFGNWLATRLLHLFYGVRYTDLGPFRAIKWNKLLQLKMNDQNFGWTVEMQLKAAKLNLKIMEVPVTYRKRIGVSKVSGTLKGTVMAGYKIISTIFKYL